MCIYGFIGGGFGNEDVLLSAKYFCKIEFFDGCFNFWRVLVLICWMCLWVMENIVLIFLRVFMWLLFNLYWSCNMFCLCGLSVFSTFFKFFFNRDLSFIFFGFFVVMFMRVFLMVCFLLFLFMVWVSDMGVCVVFLIWVIFFVDIFIFAAIFFVVGLWSLCNVNFCFIFEMWEMILNKCMGKWIVWFWLLIECVIVWWIY